jgi:alpha-mannosidase
MTQEPQHPIAERALKAAALVAGYAEIEQAAPLSSQWRPGGLHDEGVRDPWQALRPGVARRPLLSSVSLRFEFNVPSHWSADQCVTAVFELPPDALPGFSLEGLVFLDGEALVGVNPPHPQVLLPASVCDGRTHTLELDGWTGVRPYWTGERGERDTALCAMHLACIDRPVERLVVALKVTAAAVQALHADRAAQHQVVDRLLRALAVIELAAFGTPAQGQGVQAALAILLPAQCGPAAPAGATVHAVGHGHIDVAWLWPLAETRRKAARTFFIALALMRRRRDYHYLQSQPALYDMVFEQHPALEAEVRQRIAEGRWEATGAMYVEPDTNMPNGESLVRQLVLGRRRLRALAGEHESQVLWLPDTFGFSWALPQLLVQAGIRWFFTIKPSWNETNQLPADTFWWRGVDGSQVLAHVGTTPSVYTFGGQAWTSYNAQMTAAELLGTWQGRHDTAQSDFLMAYGDGDGGGGPNEAMLDAADVLRTLPGLPGVKLGRADAFFRSIEAERGPALPTWDDEIYAEFHRGVLTTQGRTKRAHRRCESLLHDTEWLCTLASVLGPAYRYPHAELEALWKRLCVTQFHDILPGSSIGAVYDDAARDFDHIAQVCAGCKAQAAAVIEHVFGPCVINTAPNPRTDLVAVGADVPVWRAAMTHWPAHSVTPLHLTRLDTTDRPHTLRIDARCVENRFLRAAFDDDGNLVDLYDKVQRRQALATGGLGNQFQAFDDRPVYSDAWDIDDPHGKAFRQTQPGAAFEVTESGPLRVSLVITRRLGASTIRQTVTLREGDARLDFHTHVDWRERHSLLKVALPLAVLCRHASYEIQWAHIQRPTHRNTSWDEAKFEGALQRWVDLSEAGFGVSVLNDGRHGADVRGHTVRLSLLRSPTEPDPQADQGEHEFTYSLLCHDGRPAVHANPQASALNLPLLHLAGFADVANLAARGPDAARDAITCFMALDADFAEIVTIKRADDDQHVVVRIAERHGRRGPVTLSALRPIQAAWRVDLLEEGAEAIPVVAGTAALCLRPFEVLTLRLELGPPG